MGEKMRCTTSLSDRRRAKWQRIEMGHGLLNNQNSIQENQIQFSARGQFAFISAHAPQTCRPMNARMAKLLYSALCTLPTPLTAMDEGMVAGQ